MKIIKRYQNRKLYDTQASKYVTLDDIAQMVKDGEDVQVVDNKTKKDLTSVTLAQIVFEEQKQRKEPLPLFTLKRIIQSGGESIQDFIEKFILPGLSSIQQAREELEKYINGLITKGSLSHDEGRRILRDLLATSQKNIDEIQKRFDERIRLVLSRMKGYTGIQQKLEKLEAQVSELEARLAAGPAKAEGKTVSKPKSQKGKTAGKPKAAGKS